ncbi:MAG TPA: hypothetical protein PKY82_11655 [Pyrinomonadaceae bacterium]|nr:hypothetical protein [Pyrinomonadaceae bacterium]
MKNLKYIVFFLIIFALKSPIFGQQVTINPFQVKTSPILEQLKTAKANNQNQSIEDLVKTANELLQTQGFNFVFGFDAATCQKIEQVKANQKDKSVPLNLRGAFTSVTGEKANLILPEAKFEKTECLACFMQIPVFEITPNDFVTSVMNQNVKLNFPQNFTVQEIQSVDNKDLKTVLKRWKIPFLTTPISISDDGNVIYLGLNEPELNDLVLMVFSEGVLQFGAKKDINSDKKAKQLKEFPEETNNPNLRFINFADENVSYTIRFSFPCS